MLWVGTRFVGTHLMMSADEHGALYTRWERRGEFMIFHLIIWRAAI